LSAGERRRVCLLTGAGGTLGTHFCRRFATRYDIAAVFRHRRPAVPAHDQVAVDPLQPDQPLPENDARVFAIQADLDYESECERVVEITLSRFDRVDLLVNCAAAAVWAPMLGTDRLIASAATQLATNVILPLRLSTILARRFWQGRDEENRAHGRNIVNVSSVAGIRLYPYSGQSVYAASKAALNHLTGHMAVEFSAVGVRVNATAANSFPSLVPVERAANAIVALDNSSRNGTLVVVDAEQDEVIELRPFAASDNEQSNA
jgi:NAD(P)-dependent dehydrogenase (short-subunit alcohol dehydrogenase family)